MQRRLVFALEMPVCSLISDHRIIVHFGDTEAASVRCETEGATSVAYVEEVDERLGPGEGKDTAEERAAITEIRRVHNAK